MDITHELRARELAHFLEHGMDLRDVHLNTAVWGLVVIDVGPRDYALYVSWDDYPLTRGWRVHDGSEALGAYHCRNAYTVGTVVLGSTSQTKVGERPSPYAHIARWRKAVAVVDHLTQGELGDPVWLETLYAGAVDVETYGQFRFTVNTVARRLGQTRPSSFCESYVRQVVFERLADRVSMADSDDRRPT